MLVLALRLFGIAAIRYAHIVTMSLSCPIPFTRFSELLVGSRKFAQPTCIWG